MAITVCVQTDSKDIR